MGQSAIVTKIHYDLYKIKIADYEMHISKMTKDIAKKIWPSTYFGFAAKKLNEWVNKIIPHIYNMY